MAKYIPKLPSLVAGVDVETKALRPDAYMLSIAATVFDIYSLSCVGATYLGIDPNDPEADKVFYTDPGTLDWWDGKGNPDYAPAPAAREAAFSGNLKIDAALRLLVDFLEPLRKKHEMVLSSRGPEFDIPIIVNGLVQCNLYQGIFRKFSANDSDRTIERISLAFGLEMDEETESHNWLKSGKEWVEHHPGFDSARTAYRTARFYHLGMIAKRWGFDVMLQAHEHIKRGDYTPSIYIEHGGKQ